MPDLRGRLLANQSLAELTWFRVGGPAQVLFTPADEDDLHALANDVAGLPSELESEDEEAKRFDLLMYRLQLAILRPARVGSLRQELLLGAESSLALRLPGLGAHAHPLELSRQRALSGVYLLLLA